MAVQCTPGVSLSVVLLSCLLPTTHAGAQCAHAAVGVIGKYRPRNEVLFRMWERCGQPKIALKIPNEEHMVRTGLLVMSLCMQL